MISVSPVTVLAKVDVPLTFRQTSQRKQTLLPHLKETNAERNHW